MNGQAFVKGFIKIQLKQAMALYASQMRCHCLLRKQEAG